MNMKIIPILAAAAVAVLAAGCHHRHNNNDYYRPGPSHHYNHNDYNNGWHHGQNRPGPKPRPHYVTANQASYPRLPVYRGAQYSAVVTAAFFRFPPFACMPEF